MKSQIHETAVISKNVHIAEDGVTVGPFCVIGFPGYQLSNNQSTPTIIETGCTIHPYSAICTGAILRRGCRIDSHCYVGERTIVGEGAVIEYGARIYNDVEIGRDVTISGFVANFCKIEDNAIVHGQLIHRFVNVTRGVPEESPKIRSRAVVGMGSIVVGPIVVEVDVYVGAGAVLTVSTQPGRLYLGCPAVDSGVAPKPWTSKQYEPNC